MADTAPDKNAWMLEAECKQVPPAERSELFFPIASGSKTYAQRRPYRIGSPQDPYREARAICARCPVREECAEYGLREPDGMFGGLDERQRAARRKLRRNSPLPLR